MTEVLSYNAIYAAAFSYCSRHCDMQCVECRLQIEAPTSGYIKPVVIPHRIMLEMQH